MSRRWELGELLALGKVLDERPAGLGGETVGTWLAETLLRVRGRDGDEMPLRANAVQRRFEEARGRSNIILKARQMGMTTWISGRFFLRTVTQPGVLSVQVAQTREAAEGIFRMVQRFWDGLPEELREGPLRLTRSNAGQMQFGAIDSEFRVLSASDENAGRGLTIQNLHCSELSRWPGDANSTLAGLRAALSRSGELVMESTPNGAYGCFYDEWMNAEERGVQRHFFPWWMEREYEGGSVSEPTLEERELMARHGLSPQQIGFRRSLQRDYRGLRLQEFAEDPQTCFRTSGACCFDQEAIERRTQEAPPPVRELESAGLTIWLPPAAGREYLVAVDTAGGGTDGDYSAAEVLEMETGLQCAELRRHLGARDLARQVARLAAEYNGALVIVERNNHGAGVLAYLDAAHPEVRVYDQGGLPGWLTSGSSKPRMVHLLGTLLAEQPWLFASRRLLAECRTYVTLPNGATGAAPGTHDDCVMAMAIGHAVRTELLNEGNRRPPAAERASVILQRRGAPSGGAGGPGSCTNARWCTEPADAGSRRTAVGRQVPEQPTTPARAGQ